MPFSRSRSPESMTRSATLSAWCAVKAPAWRSIASTSVVLPWSTWATIATLRRSERDWVDMQEPSGRKRGSDERVAERPGAAGTAAARPSLVPVSLDRRVGEAVRTPGRRPSPCRRRGVDMSHDLSGLLHLHLHPALARRARRRARRRRPRRGGPRRAPPRGGRARAAVVVPRGARRGRVHDAGSRTTLPGTPVRSAGEPATGDVAVDEAAAGIAATLEMFAEDLGRDSHDDAGAPVSLTVHYGQAYDNAFWDGTQLVFGDGDGRIFERFTKPVDVLAHEFSHAVVEHTADLTYRGQSGALNESVADVFAACLKQRVLGQDAGRGRLADRRGHLHPAVQARALRDMAAPGTAYDDPELGADPQVGHMDDYVVTASDNGGVHLNSGIPNKAFQLAAVAVGGRAIEGAGRIWYDALVGGDVAVGRRLRHLRRGDGGGRRRARRRRTTRVGAGRRRRLPPRGRPQRPPRRRPRGRRPRSSAAAASSGAPCRPRSTSTDPTAPTSAALVAGGRARGARRRTSCPSPTCSSTRSPSRAASRCACPSTCSAAASASWRDGCSTTASPECLSRARRPPSG